ncbi:hypothetical protein [Flectobacillus roseus]|uniref:DUF2513 domain-containing protein n=1 Tax=Flectobacillus roseus TaxID=502259 RepID=A0ABT6Y3K3_9BACT|nr:hypothetical protein [Flectobacillus roseus]MDI9858143.1 hypothetical protein [Flectobacillus roseus]
MILFNTLKHHLPSIIDFIANHTVDSEVNLSKLGDSLMDLYTGHLSLDSIFEETLYFLKEQGITSEEDYRVFLEKHQGYATFQLSDTSKWVFLWGNEPERYVHIHPARYSPFTIRIKSATLKTAVMLKIRNVQQLDTDSINTARKSIGLSPIKSMEKVTNIIEAMTLLETTQA